MLRLEAGDYELAIEPERGGSIAALRWRAAPLLRETCGPSILDTACFPLVPFSNRIAHGRFHHGGRDVLIPPNFPGGDHPHPLHGFGWTSAWAVLAADGRTARIAHGYPGGDWPWPYHAEQAFALDENGLSIVLSLTNTGDEAMPAGLGFHPYFPRDVGTFYRGLHRREWITGGDGLPIEPHDRENAVDWWAGRPVGERAVDTVYEGRDGSLTISWLRRGIALSIEPSPLLDHSVVYVPQGKDFFCVEPVSHMTNAINRKEDRARLANLRPGETISATMRLRAQSLR